MDRWVGKVAVVTGASSGIGECISATLVEAGLRVVGLARRLEKMQETAKRLSNAKGTFYPIQCDVAKEAEILQAFKFARSLGGIDVLVNNAGIAFPETIIDGTTENYQSILNVNVLAAAICTREATRSMRERNVEGHVININSIVGHETGKAQSPLSLYHTSKFAMTAMSEVTRHELAVAKAQVKVTNVSPGLVKTEMPIIQAYGGEEMFKTIPHIQCQDVANAILYVIGTPSYVQVAELTIIGL